MNSEIFEIYGESNDLVLPELEGLGWCNTDMPRFGGPRTDGRAGLEIGYLHRGGIEWLTEDGLDEAGPRSVILDWPGDWQGGENALIHPCERFWVRFNFPPIGRMPGLPDATVAALERIFTGMSARHFPASAQMLAMFQRLLGQQRDPGGFAEDVSRAAFHQILFMTVEDFQRDQSVSYSGPVRAALRIFEERVGDECRVEEVAREVDLSVGYFYELFVREVGYTPSAYHLHRRITAAKRLMIGSDMSITALSMELGFSSSQYFATSFKKVVGISPGEYRRLRESGGRTPCAPPAPEAKRRPGSAGRSLGPDAARN